MTNLNIEWRRNNAKVHRDSLKKRLTKKTTHVLFNSLRSAVREADVQSAWRTVFTEYYCENDKDDDYEITSPENVDGFISSRSGKLVFPMRLLLEFKYGKDLTNTYEKAKIVCQCIHYMYILNKNYELPI